MNLKAKKPSRLAWLLPATALALAACGSPAPEPQTLEERVQARWQHIIERDFEAAWEYYAPGYRETNPRSAFVDDMAGRPVIYKNASVQGADCEGDRCQVRVRVTYQVVDGPRGVRDMRVPSTINERWISLNEQWWFSG